MDHAERSSASSTPFLFDDDTLDVWWAAVEQRWGAMDRQPMALQPQAFPADDLLALMF